MIKDYQSLPVFLFSACIRKREGEGDIEHEHKEAHTRVLKDIFTSLQQPQNIYHYTICETWEVQTLSLDPSTHSDGMQTVLSTPEHSCKLSYGSSQADVLTMEAFSHITGVRAPVTGSQNCPDGSRKFIFFQITGTGWHTLLL